jgi:hypothetical protein
MATDYTEVFSEYEIDKMSIKVDGEATFTANDCVGSVEEELEVKEVTKSCRGVVKKIKVRGEGTGTVTVSAHWHEDIYNKIYAMGVSGLIDGVKAYGTNSNHPFFTMIMHVMDEDGIEKFKAYPKCIMRSRPKKKTENGAEEVAEVEMEIGVMPDDYGNTVYEALASTLPTTGTITKDTFMTAFTAAAMQKAA